ncbi:MAG: hypothetical protein LBL69_00230, partial [Zoogloeaceae bacterium]|nr:hypothetical protein [Zoogloeaceae bacterium]
MKTKSGKLGLVARGFERRMLPLLVAGLFCAPALGQVTNISVGNTLDTTVSGLGQVSTIQNDGTLRFIQDNATASGADQGTVSAEIQGSGEVVIDTMHSNAGIPVPSDNDDSMAAYDSLSFTGANTYTGGTTLISGTLGINNPDALGAGNLHFARLLPVDGVWDTFGNTPPFSINVT